MYILHVKSLYCAPDLSSRVSQAREKSEDNALNYLTLPHLPVVQSNDIRTQEQCGIEETSTLLNIIQVTLLC